MLLGMTETDENQTDDGTEDDNVSTDKAKKKKQLEKELADLDGSEDTVEGEVTEVLDAAAEAAEKEAKKGEKDPAEVDEAAKDAAQDIADEAEKAGVVLTPQEQESLASNISEKIYQKMQEATTDEKAPRERKPDKRPQSTHFTERRIGRRRKE